jgi:hypothetical protein
VDEWMTNAAINIAINVAIWSFLRSPLSFLNF